MEDRTKNTALNKNNYRNRLLKHKFDLDMSGLKLEV